MTEISAQIVEAIKDKDFWKTAKKYFFENLEK